MAQSQLELPAEIAAPGFTAQADVRGGASRLDLAGQSFFADVFGALFWPAEATLIVADLHLEKGSSYAERGLFLPPYDTRTTLTRLAAVIERWQPRTVICLGDSFHDQGGADRLDAVDHVALERMAAARDWLWLAGNHDPVPPRFLGGTVASGDLRLGGLELRHAAAASAGPEISGHYHPKASIAVHGRRVTCRCFVEDGRRLILPAFGAYTGGLDVFDKAIAGFFDPGFRVHMLGRERVTIVPAAALTPEARQPHPSERRAASRARVAG